MFNRDFPLDQKSVIPAQAGIQFIEKLLRSRSTFVLCPLCGLFYCWIDACAGTTGQMESLGLNQADTN
jgi:hypothetical protein